MQIFADYALNNYNIRKLPTFQSVIVLLRL